MCINYALMGDKEKAMSFSGGVYEHKELVDAFVTISEHKYNDALKYLLKREKTMTSFQKDIIRFQIAICYINLGQFNKAEKYLKDIHSMKGDYTSIENTLYPISYYWLGIINQELGKNSIAMAHYKKFLNYWQNADPDIIELNDAKKRLDDLESNV